MSSLVSLICSSAQIVGLIQAEVFPISEFLVKTFSSVTFYWNGVAIANRLIFNSFQANIPFQYPLKTSEDQSFFWSSHCVKKWNIGLKWVEEHIDHFCGFNSTTKIQFIKTTDVHWLSNNSWKHMYTYLNF